MMPPRYANRWSRRERRQGRHLKKALRGRYQKSFRRPQDELPGLSAEAQTSLNAHNPYSRTIWFRAVAGHLCSKLGATAPDWNPTVPVYFLTVIDTRQKVSPGTGPQGEDEGPSLSQIRQTYFRLLRGLNYFGMIDAALYVSTRRTHQVPRIIQYHVHAVVWGISEEDLDLICEEIREEISALLPGATPALPKPVRVGGLRQVIWYTMKMPRKQYQLWKRASGRLKQYKRQIQGVNAVRLYDALRNVNLDQLTLAGGQGTKCWSVLARTLSGFEAVFGTCPRQLLWTGPGQTANFYVLSVGARRR